MWYVACKDEFRRNPRFHSWLFFFEINVLVCGVSPTRANLAGLWNTRSAPRHSARQTCSWETSVCHACAIPWIPCPSRPWSRRGPGKDVGYRTIRFMNSRIPRWCVYVLVIFISLDVAVEEKNGVNFRWIRYMPVSYTHLTLPTKA